jgi:hypothetical protein
MKTYKGKCMVDWEADSDGNQYWVCRHQWLNCNRKFKPEQEVCYHYKCPGRRESTIIKQPVEIEPKVEAISEEVAICAWFRCDLPVAPNKLRHCSEVCRKRQNRWDYKQRQKAKKKNESSS